MNAKKIFYIGTFYVFIVGVYSNFIQMNGGKKCTQNERINFEIIQLYTRQTLVLYLLLPFVRNHLETEFFIHIICKHSRTYTVDILLNDILYRMCVTSASLRKKEEEKQSEGKQIIS